MWLAYKKEKRQTYKPRGLAALKKNLLQLSNGNPEYAKVIVEYSMGNNYTGLFAPKNNYVNYSKNVTATPLFLERFFDNLLFGAKHELHNRDMHISKCQSDTENSPKCQIGPLDVTLEEKVLLEFVKANPKATQEQIGKHIGKSSRTVKRITASTALISLSIMKKTASHAECT